MGWKRVYSSYILTFYLFGRTLSSPKINSLPCVALSRFYPNRIVYGILAECVAKGLKIALAEYCDELHQLQEEICGKNFIDVLNSISPGTDQVITTVPFVKTGETVDHCKSFNSLNETLYNFYLDKPGLGKKLSDELVCSLFCSAHQAECETLLRTYWAMKVLQEYKEKDEDAEGKNVTDLGQAAPSAPDAEHNGKNSPKKPENNPTTKNDNTKELEGEIKGIVTSLGGDKPNEAKQNLKPTEPASTQSSKKGDNDIGSKQPNENSNKPASTGKPKQDDKLSIGKQKDEEKTKNDKDKDIMSKQKSEDNAKSNKPQMKDTTRGRETTPSLVTEPRNDGGQENDKVEGITSQEASDKISGDVATTTEADTEFGNQIHDIGDGFGEQDNEYPPEEPEIPVSDIEMPQSGSADENNNNKKTQQHDGTSVEKQPADASFPGEEGGHFFAYFLAIIVLCIAGYLVFHNKQKIIALIVEGRHERRRRPNNGAYKRLDTKEGAKATSHVVF